MAPAHGVWVPKCEGHKAFTSKMGAIHRGLKSDVAGSHETLRKKMSELISLRERVAQAELAAGAGRGGFAPTCRDPNEDDSFQG